MTPPQGFGFNFLRFGAPWLEHESVPSRVPHGFSADLYVLKRTRNGQLPRISPSGPRRSLSRPICSRVTLTAPPRCVLRPSLRSWPSSRCSRELRGEMVLHRRLRTRPSRGAASHARLPQRQPPLPPARRPARLLRALHRAPTFGSTR